jgi:exodeoxyribonuclease V alpha subunit
VERPGDKGEALSGVVERIIFFNEENHYTIAEFRADSAKDKVTITGALPGVQCGETLHLRGGWTRHAQHGDQFRVTSFTSELPASVYGIRKYLGSGLVPGIGKVYANKIVDVFGEDTFRVLSEESGRLRDVPGIGKVRAASIKRSWDEQQAFRELYIFLQTYGVTTSQCVKLIQRFGGEARRILATEPYRAAREIDGIGFRTADRIAINLGFANDAPPRLDAGTLFAMQTLEEEGHTAIGADDLRDHATQMLETRADLVAARIDALVAARDLVRQENGVLQLPVHDRAEQRIAGVVGRLAKAGSGLPPIRIDAAVTWAEEKAGFAFADRQRDALRNALASPFSIVTGGPGTGKTTILRALVDILKAKKARVHLAAPTGRASQRLAEATGGFASTLHRLLKFDPSKGGFAVNEAHPLGTDFLIVDEASMLDNRLAASLLQAVPSRAHLLLVGDTDQLPSVGAGNVLKDLIASGAIPVTRLEVVFRQKQQSEIVSTAHAVNAGDASLPGAVTDLEGIQAWKDLTFVVATSAEDAVEKTIALCTQVVPRHFRWADPIHDVQVLAPMHKGVAGVANLNARLQEALNGGTAGVRGPIGEFRPGDKVIQLRNNYDKGVFNGDIGRVVEADTAEGALTVDFDGDRHPYVRGELGEIAPAYAVSIHKSQGSEYPLVIIPLLKAHFMMLQRNLLYTAITRGKKKVFVVGEPAAWAMAVRNSDAKTRSTHLLQKIGRLSG